MGLTDVIRDRLLSWLLPEEYMDPVLRERLTSYSLRQQYYQGNYRKQLRIKPMQADDNIGLNFSGLIVDRSISMLLGNGIRFDLGDNQPAQEYIDKVMKANKINILLHKAAQYASIYGTGYLKIIPGGAEVRSSTENIFVPRLVAVDPYWVRIATDPEDIEQVESYTFRYNIASGDEQVARMEVISREKAGETEETTGWMISNYKSNRATAGRWEMISQDPWDYEFPPIIHWQNLPQPSDVYGQSDIEDVIEPQDRYNFVSSNISKIIRYHAHPKTWGRGAANPTKVSWGADEMLMYQGDNAQVSNLEMQSDLTSSRAYALDLRQSIFDISRTVDLTSISDKIGALTNFGLRVLYQDALSKNGTKQELLGEALVELVHCLLSMETIEHTDGGSVVWADPLPVDELQEISAVEKDLNMGIVSKKTASTKRGYDWDDEEQRILEDKTSDNNMGSLILNAFNKGQ